MSSRSRLLTRCVAVFGVASGLRGSKFRNDNTVFDVVNDMSIQLSIAQAAEHFSVSSRTIHRWIQSSKVEAEKIDGQWVITTDKSLNTVIDNVYDDGNDMVLTLSRQCQLLESQLLAKDEQIKKLQQAAEGLQQALDQSQQLHAMSEKRHESELSAIKGRSFLQRLKAVLVANP